MAGLSEYLISWFYSPSTKLGIYFNDFGTQNLPNPRIAQTNSGIDARSGLTTSEKEIYTYSASVTRHPVDVLAPVTDHIIPQPVSLVFTGLVSALQPLLLVSQSVDFLAMGKATDVLIKMAQKNTGISVTTGLLLGESYYRASNLAVEKLVIERTSRYGKNAVYFTLSLTEIFITSARRITTSEGEAGVEEDTTGAEP